MLHMTLNFSLHVTDTSRRSMLHSYTVGINTVCTTVIMLHLRIIWKIGWEKSVSVNLFPTTCCLDTALYQLATVPNAMDRYMDGKEQRMQDEHVNSLFPRVLFIRIRISIPIPTYILILTLTLDLLDPQPHPHLTSPPTLPTTVQLHLQT
jgi:hypothetical protein